MNKAKAWRPHEMPTLLINRLARALLKPTDERLREVGISSSQLPVLVALKDGGKRTQKELADLANVEQPSMAQLLARMERDRLIAREASSTDRRSSLIFLTDRARQLLEPGRAVLRDIDQNVCAALSKEEKEVLVSLLQRLMASVTGEGND
ncbi:MarR family winged helix-turn-helix transcriptional regulator [Herbaspirillum chlorophenolicum]|jgi:DNA-binding MarR family transcriptional regulator|uniref:MarR family winged helix-turn-helix transcriptional regulator n=1 Tax=Herbaspirillum chlorophenolicum TaxID=211589 RepID=UPI000AE25296|nr:MarR family transcriptional regulator [Herbaspirillum chlorophenolicum]